jgi:hypothetical protein
MSFRVSNVSVPLHAESIPLNAGPRAAAVAIAAVSIGTGLGIGLGWDEPAARLVSSVLVVLGGVTIWLTVRGARCEVTIGATRIDVRAGLLAATAPTAAVESLDRCEATSWRRWYAPEEVRAKISVTPGQIAIPTRKARAVVIALSGDTQDDGE